MGGKIRQLLPFGPSDHGHITEDRYLQKRFHSAKFAELKDKRLNGFISHAAYPISTVKLEGFNNKIKVAKRIGYDFRNDDYFFTLIKYLSLSSVRKRFHNFR
ncbi:MAG: transposase [Clostridia bacterium]|nr:transposase [Clostridia bacterium]